LKYFVSTIIEAPDYPDFYHELDLSFKEKIAVISGATKIHSDHSQALDKASM
jgi:hypothetical protein